MLIRNITISATAALLLATAPALAQDENASEPANWVFDLSFGATVTSNYVSRGTSQSDGPALQGYLEATYGIFYAGVWASGVDPVITGGNVEVDVYGGIRPEFGDLSLDIGYARYYYPPVGDCCGEGYVKASYAFTDMFSANGEIYRDFEFKTTWAQAGAEISGLPGELVLSGNIGTDFSTLALGKDKVAWDVGVSRTFADTVTLDVRYHDSNMDPARIVASLSLDSSFSALKELFSK